MSAYQHESLQQTWQHVLASPVASAQQSVPFQHCFATAAQTYNLPASLLHAVARGESNFNPKVVSKANAIGVMQIQWPGTAHHLGIFARADLYKPCLNIDAGARYLRELIDRFGDVHTALAAYNYGPTRIQRAGTRLPQGALWYSSYILDHWRHLTSSSLVAESSTVQAPSSPVAQDSGPVLVELIRFREPFRAQGFVATLRQQHPAIQFDWFRGADAMFSVTATYRSASVAHTLRTLGFSVP